jgi:hypothetical protein
VRLEGLDQLKNPVTFLKYHAVKAYEGVESQLQAFLTLALDGVEL